MQIQQRVWKLRLWQYLTFHPARRTNKIRLDAGLEFYEGARDRESGIEMSARATSGENHMQCDHRMAELIHGVPKTRSRVLPMFTTIPVISIDSNRFDRP